MSDPKPEYPASEPGDPEEVVLALETGRALWSKGDLRDAIRWLQKAAMKSLQVGNHVRAAVLTRTAAEFGSSLTIRPAPPLGQSSSSSDADGEYADKTIVDRVSDVATRQKPAASASSGSARSALRVAVTPATTGGSRSLVVRVLADGQSAPPDAHEAMLVPLAPGTDFFKPKR
jgi:hypothetical protein